MDLASEQEFEFDVLFQTDHAIPKVKPVAILGLKPGRRLRPNNSNSSDAFLTLSRAVRIMIFPHADVAELADAQVSEACDGDIVEVQVLSSAPIFANGRRVS